MLISYLNSDHLQEAGPSGLSFARGRSMGMINVIVVVVLFGRRRKTEKEMEENIWRRKINGDADQPTNQLSDRANIVQSAYSKDGK